MKQLKLVIWIIVIMFIGCGCLPTMSLDEYGYVLFVGVDPGSLLPYEVTMMLQKTEDNGNTQQLASVLLLSVECADLFEAVDLLSASVPYQLNMSRVSGIVFSKELAQNGQMRNFLDMSFGRLRMRHYINIMISQDGAKEFLKGIGNMPDLVVSKLHSSLLSYSFQTGFVPICNLSLWNEAVTGKTGDAVIALCAYNDEVEPIEEEPSQQTPQLPVKTPVPTPATLPESDSVHKAEYGYLPDQLLRQGGLQSILMGSALFDGDKMVGYLDGQHTQLLLMAVGQFEKGFVQLPGPRGEHMNIALMKHSSPTTTLDTETATATVSVSLVADIDIPEILTGVSAEELQAHIERYLEENMDIVFKTCQKLGADSFGMGQAAVRHFTSTEDWENFDWDGVYQKLQATFEISVKLGHHPEKSNLE